jgi:hypothetical protein
MFFMRFLKPDIPVIEAREGGQKSLEEGAERTPFQSRLIVRGGPPRLISFQSCIPTTANGTITVFLKFQYV